MGALWKLPHQAQRAFVAWNVSIRHRRPRGAAPGRGWHLSKPDLLGARNRELAGLRCVSVHISGAPLRICP